MVHVRFAVIVAALAVFASSHGDVVGHWKFDESSGTTASDSSPSANAGTLFGSASFVGAGVSGNCLDITSTGGGYVRFGDVLPFTTGSFSISIWAKTTVTASQAIVGKHHTGSLNGYMIASGTSVGYGAVNKAWFYQSNSPAGEPISSSDVNDGLWHHIVGVYEAGNLAKIYLDGQFEASRPTGNIQPNFADLCVGGLLYNTTGTYQNTFEGQVDDVQVYNRVLSPDEISLLNSNPGSESWRVRGQVTQNSVGLQGATVNLRQGANLVATASTSATGDYEIIGLEQGAYTIQPTHNDKVFFPATKDVTLAPDADNQNFVAGNVGPVSVTFQYPVVYGGQSRQGLVGLNTTTPVNRIVGLSDNSFKLTTPTSMTVPSGQQNAAFFVYGVTVTADTLVTVTAQAQGLVTTGQIIVRPKPILTTMNLALTTVKGGRGVAGNVSIDKPAIGHMALYLTSDNLAVATIAPANTAFTNNVSTKNFYCRTFPVTSTQVVTFTATFYGSTTTQQLTVTP